MVKEKTLSEYKQSAIKMEKNDQNLYTENSCHINIRSLFVKDKVDSGDIKIEYCHTKDMIAGFFTKTL